MVVNDNNNNNIHYCVLYVTLMVFKNEQRKQHKHEVIVTALPPFASGAIFEFNNTYIHQKH